MRTFIKDNLSSLCDTMLLLHEEVRMEVNREVRIEQLNLCQEAAIAVGTQIEQEKIRYMDAISNLERYCEELFRVASLNQIQEEDIAILCDFIHVAKEHISRIRTTYHVVFMPYQPSMWDSLESVWEAFAKDDRWECEIVPIPYNVKNADKGIWEPRYEGEGFAQSLPITHYTEYSLKDKSPDVAFIHNSFDDHNLVTRVDKPYFTRNLKKHVHKLIYIPYYATTGWVEQSSYWLYDSLDYVVMQSNYMKELHRGLPNYEKMVPLGTPKFDKVAKVCQEGGTVLDEWYHQLHGKTVIMVNTTIQTILKFDNKVFEKLQHVFKYIASKEDVAVIWRPHPLLENTMQSMRPHLLEPYHELVQYFVENRIGVLDQTSSIENTVAISHAYLGDGSSSVRNLFGIVGKPVFEFNYLTKNNIAEEDKRKFRIANLCSNNNKHFCTSFLCGGLFEMDYDLETVTYLESNRRESCANATHPMMCSNKSTLYLAPFTGKVFMNYDINLCQFHNMAEVDQEINVCREVISYKHKVIYLPHESNTVIVYDTNTWKMRFYDECIQSMKAAPKSKIRTDYTAYAVYKDELWLCAEYTNRLIQFNLESETYEIFEVGSSDAAYTGILVDGDSIWLCMADSGDIVSYHKITKEYNVYTLPKHITKWNEQAEQRSVYCKMYLFDSYIIVVPAFSNCIVKINKDTKEISCICEDLITEEYLLDDNNYTIKVNRVINFSMKYNETELLVQLTKDSKLVRMNVLEETYQVTCPTITEESYERLVKDMASQMHGFTKLSMKHAFGKIESRYFDLEEFIDDLAAGQLDDMREKQIEIMQSTAANSDGTCGQKVYEYFSNMVLEEA